MSFNDRAKIALARKRDHKAKRKCLKCDKIFFSSWAGHRICSFCKKLNETKGEHDVQGI